MENRTRVTEAVLVVVDISGYTRFVQQRAVSLEHAEAIVTELIESIIDEVSHPLLVNKLEGDAALLYAETGGDTAGAVRSALWQASRLFSAFSGCLVRIKEARRHCTCDACANIGTLRLKAFLHVGEIVVKQVRQFEEIAGDAVILVHRMAKNGVPLHEYALMTQAFLHALDDALGDAARDLMPQRERFDGKDTLLHWCDLDTLVRCAQGLPAPAANQQPPAAVPQPVHSTAFRHLPPSDGGFLGGLLRRIFGR